jgi:hypothetical protein
MQHKWFTLGALIACWTVSASADDLKPFKTQQAVTDHLVFVQEVNGQAEYSYRGFSWQPLSPGKILKAGATLRTTPESSVTLKMGDYDNLVRVAPATSLQLVSTPPAQPAKKAEISLMPPNGAARVRSLRGKATVFQEGAWRRMKVNSIVEPGATVITEQKTQLDLFFPREGLVVRMKPKTVLSLKQAPREGFAGLAASNLRLAVAQGGVQMNKGKKFLADDH